MEEDKTSQPCILIVDDISKNIQVLATILDQEGYKIIAAQSGKQALKVAEKFIPDLILLDIMMPVMDGFETCMYLKDNPHTKDIPVIFLTAKTESRDIIRGFEAGAVDYVTKPFNSKELCMRVKTHMDLKISKEKLFHVSNERKELLHVLCHDLTTPFNAIISILDVADSRMEFDQFKEMLRSTAYKGLELIELIRHIRYLEEYDLDLKPTNLKQSLFASQFLLRNLLEKKEVTLSMNVADHLYIEVENTSFVHSVLNNLLTNAIKFSYRGAEIRIDAEETDEEVVLRIQDKGIGMREKLLEDLFDIGKKTSRPGTEDESGTGFGMPLIRKFMDTYKGQVQVFSKSEDEYPEDHGTTVELTLKKAASPGFH